VNNVVLGGAWKPSTVQFEAAYLLSCESLQEAREIAESDLLIRADAIRCEVVEWKLVGVNPDDVDRDSLLYPLTSRARARRVRRYRPLNSGFSPAKNAVTPSRRSSVAMLSAMPCRSAWRCSVSELSRLLLASSFDMRT
jgi:hypothetical protein